MKRLSTLLVAGAFLVGCDEPAKTKAPAPEKTAQSETTQNSVTQAVETPETAVSTPDSKKSYLNFDLQVSPLVSVDVIYDNLLLNILNVRANHLGSVDFFSAHEAVMNILSPTIPEEQLFFLKMHTDYRECQAVRQGVAFLDLLRQELKDGGNLLPNGLPATEKEDYSTVLRREYDETWLAFWEALERNGAKDPISAAHYLTQKHFVAQHEPAAQLILSRHASQRRAQIVSFGYAFPHMLQTDLDLRQPVTTQKVPMPVNDLQHQRR